MKLNVTEPTIFVCFCLISGMFSLQGYAQKDYQLPKTREVVVNSGDSVIKANILYDLQKNVRTKDDRPYFWYAANEIHQNTGGYEGKLLYNEYKVFNKNNQLVMKGSFKKGLKEGKWMEWYPSGKIKSITHWKKGLQSGRSISYDEQEKLLEKSIFRKGIKKGKGKEFDGKADYNKVKYVDLKKVPPQKPTGVKRKKEKKDRKFRLFGKKNEGPGKEKEAAAKNKVKKTSDKDTKNARSGKEKKKKEKKEKTTKN